MRASAGLLGIVIVSIAVIVALFAGFISAIFPWWLAIGLFVPPLVIWAGSRWPYVAMVFTLLAAYGYIPVGVIGADIIVMVFVAFIFVVYRRHIFESWANYKNYWITLICFMMWALSMVIYGYFYRRNMLGDVYSETMSVAYWMITAPILLMAKNKKSTTYVWYVLLGVSFLLCIVAISQSIFTIKLNFSGLGSVAELTSEDGGVAGLARSGVPGIMAVVFLFLLALTNLLTSTGRIGLWWFVLGVATFAIFVTFGRAVWAGTFVGALFVSMLAGRRAFIRFLIYGSISVAVLVVLLLVFKPEVVYGLLNRIFSVNTEFSGKAGGSYQWRVIENHFAKIQIANHPFFGLGLGGQYKPRLIDFRIFTAQMTYIHNGFYFITLKMGFIGLFFYLLHFLNIMRISWVNRHQPGVEPVPQYALIATFACTLMINVTQPELMTGPSIAALASLAAAVISMGHWQRDGIAQSSAS